MSAGRHGREKSENEKWLANLSKVKTFIADERRKPRDHSSDAGERKLAMLITTNKKNKEPSERNNERKQLMRMDIPEISVHGSRGQKRK
jgi:hypothetical protein